MKKLNVERLKKNTMTQEQEQKEPDWKSLYAELIGRYNEIVTILSSAGLEMQIVAKKHVEAQVQANRQLQPQQ